jgi:Uma2 family endonuclease
MVATRRLTLDEYLELPEQKPYLEFVDGEVVEKVSAQLQHALLQKRLLMLLDGLRERGLESLSELRFIFGDPPRAYLPDVALARRAELPRDEWGRARNRIDGPPAVAIEILSPDDKAGRLLEKLSFYMENGADLALVVDPEVERVSVYRPGEAAVLFDRGASIELAPVVPGFFLELDQVFSALEL